MNNGRLDREVIYKRIEERTGIPRNKVKEAVKHQFSRTAELMASGDRESRDFPSIRLQYFGKFEAHPKRIKEVQENARTNSQSD